MGIKRNYKKGEWVILLSKQTFLKGNVIEGKAKYFTLKGKIFSEVNYINGKKKGPAIYYHENGNKKDSGNFKSHNLPFYRYAPQPSLSKLL